MRSELRAETQTADSWSPGCVWPGCLRPQEEMAHLHSIGMGGRPSADIVANTVMLCRFHHDLLDGRTHMSLRFELGELLAGYVKERRGPTSRAEPRREER